MTSEAVEAFEFWANHFAFRDWDYTRKTNIKDIYYTKDSGWETHNKLSYRLKRSWEWLTWSKKHGIFFGGSIKSRVSMAYYSMKRDRHQPDGVLDGGNVIVFWEETGDYLRYIQPTVGALLATFLKEEPNHPHAQRIIAEMERLHLRYQERVARGEVTGKPEPLEDDNADSQ